MDIERTNYEIWRNSVEIYIGRNYSNLEVYFFEGVVDEYDKSGHAGAVLEAEFDNLADAEKYFADCRSNVILRNKYMEIEEYSLIESHETLLVNEWCSDYADTVKYSPLPDRIDFGEFVYIKNTSGKYDLEKTDKMVYRVRVQDGEIGTITAYATFDEDDAREFAENERGFAVENNINVTRIYIDCKIVQAAPDQTADEALEDNDKIGFDECEEIYAK